MNQKNSNAIASLLRKSVGLPAKGSSCCGGNDRTEATLNENTDAEKNSDTGERCGSKQRARAGQQS